MVKQPNKTWKKKELIDYAKNQGIKVDKTLTKEEILTEIQKKSTTKKEVSPIPKEDRKETLEKKEQKEEKKEDVQIIEKGEYIPKQKPELDPKTKVLLQQKGDTKKRSFHRQEWFRYKRLGDKWRRPRGRHSKLRKNLKYRPPKVRIGYRTHAAIRDLHPSGFQDILIHNIQELEKLDPKKQAARIAGTVGGKKRSEIQQRADEKGIRILNRRR